MLILVALLALIAFGGLGYIFVSADASQAKTAKRIQVIASQGKGEKARRTSQDVAVNRRKQILTRVFVRRA